MKSLLISTITILCFTQLLFGQAKIGMVNSEEILAGHPKLLKNAEDQLTREHEAWRSGQASWEEQMTRSRDAILTKEERLQKGQMFTEDKKKELGRELDSLKADFQMKLNEQLTKEQDWFNRRKAEILNESLQVVNEIIQEIGENKDYDLIIDEANGTVLYVKQPEIITDEVLRTLKDR